MERITIEELFEKKACYFCQHAYDLRSSALACRCTFDNGIRTSKDTCEKYEIQELIK